MAERTERGERSYLLGKDVGRREESIGEQCCLRR
jgi:hypothetical protein